MFKTENSIILLFHKGHTRTHHL
uniref:Uncharacterized protein n=1 Tax=Anguilla anguilla TaxID=7936 RepID=A0A0E9RU37_ANGAN